MRGDPYRVTGAFENEGLQIVVVPGVWPDDQWKGWWGDNRLYHAPTFVLTHYPRPPIEMLGGTTFYFVPDGIEDALQRAREAAGAKDVKIGGGVETVTQYVQAGYVDKIHFALFLLRLVKGNHALAARIFAAGISDSRARTNQPSDAHCAREVELAKSSKQLSLIDIQFTRKLFDGDLVRLV